MLSLKCICFLHSIYVCLLGTDSSAEAESNHSTTQNAKTKPNSQAEEVQYSQYFPHHTFQKIPNFFASLLHKNNTD